MNELGDIEARRILQDDHVRAVRPQSRAGMVHRGDLADGATVCISLVAQS